MSFDLSYGNGSALRGIERALQQAAMVSKAGISTATGITAYNLEPKALGLYFDGVPFLELIPRTISHKGDVGVHWKVITATDLFNVSMGVQEGLRTGSITPAVVPNYKLYATLGKETNYTFEAEEAAESFDDVPAKSSTQLLSAFRVGESKILGYGNGTQSLGTTPTPVASVGVAAGTLPAASYVVRAVALSYHGVQAASVANGVVTTATRQNNDGTSTTITGGSAIASDASNTVTLSANGSVSAIVQAVPNAYGYAWFIGTSAGNATLAAITQVNTVVLTAPAAGTQLASAITADNSANPLIYDGLATQFATPGSGGYFRSLDGASLTPDGQGGVEEFSTMFQSMWDNYKVFPTHIVCNGLVKRAITKVILSSAGPVFRVDVPAGATGVTSGTEVTYLVNPINGSKVQIVVDPWAPQNFAMAFTNNLYGYDAPDVPRPFELECRMRDYYQIDWPVTTRTKYKGVYYSGVLKVYAPFVGGILPNIGTANV